MVSVVGAVSRLVLTRVDAVTSTVFHPQGRVFATSRGNRPCRFGWLPDAGTRREQTRDSAMRVWEMPMLFAES